MPIKIANPNQIIQIDRGFEIEIEIEIDIVKVQN